jgi:hypothetical protein
MGQAKRNNYREDRRPITKNFYRNYQVFQYYQTHKDKGVTMEQAGKAFNIRSKQRVEQILNQVKAFLEDYKRRPHKYTDIKLDDVA